MSADRGAEGTPDAGAGRSGALKALGLLVATLIAYTPALHGAFLWDDDFHVAQNATLRTLAGLVRIWSEPQAIQQYYPLTHTSFWIEYHLWGTGTLGYHVVNVLLHVANALLLQRVLARLRVPGAWLAAAIFAVHPIEVESVAWISERKNVLCGVFALSALLAYLRLFRLTDDAPSARSAGTEILALVLFTCALLAKTVAASLPVVLLVLIWWRRGRIRRSELVTLIAPLAVALALGAQTAWIEVRHIGATGEEFELSAAERLLVAGRALWFYLAKLVWPAQLPFIHPRWTLDPAQAWQWAFPAAAAAAGGALLALQRRLGRGPFAAALSYAVLLGPALGFFNVYPMRYSFVANHFAYLATMAPIALFAAAAVRASAPLPRALAWGLAAGLLGALATLTHHEAGRFEDSETLWTTTLAQNPGCWMCEHNLGIVRLQHGDAEGALAHARAALALRPEHEGARTLMANALAIEGRHEEAIAVFEQILAERPDDLAAHANLGNLLSTIGRYDEADTHFQAALRLAPQDGVVRYGYGRMLLDRGRPGAAAAQLAEAVRIDPGSADAAANLGLALVAAGRIPEGVTWLERAQQLAPGREDLAQSLKAARAKLAAAPGAPAGP